MGTIPVSNQELFSVMQYTNMVKMKLGYNDIWFVVPVLYSSEGSVEILMDRETGCSIVSPGEKAILKFQKLGYEFLIHGDISDVRQGSHNTLAVIFNTAQKYYNLRKFMRFDTSLKASLKGNSGKSHKSILKNISKGGAMITSKADLSVDDVTETKITFASGEKIACRVKVLRKVSAKENGFDYGVQFLEISDSNAKILSHEIAQYESEYLKSLYLLREYSKKSEISIDTKISVFSFNEADESYGVKEELVKMGAENFDVFYSFKFYVDYFIEEKPKIVIIDSGVLDNEVISFIENIKADFPEKSIILLLPFEYVKKEEQLKPLYEQSDILFKPLICNEFEQGIIKYL